MTSWDLGGGSVVGGVTDWHRSFTLRQRKDGRFSLRMKAEDGASADTEWGTLDAVLSEAEDGPFWMDRETANEAVLRLGITLS
jgi:hypothetical protein